MSSRTTPKKATPSAADIAEEANEAYMEMLGRPRRRKPFALAYDADRQDEVATTSGEVIRLRRASEAKGATPADKAAHTKAAKALALLREETNAMVFHLASLTANDYEALVDKHQCSPEKNLERKAAGLQEYLLDPDEYPAAIVEAVVESVDLPSGKSMPGFTAAQYKGLGASYYSPEELDQLFEACVLINKSPVSAALMGKG
jgi:hypothetical protein